MIIYYPPLCCIVLCPDVPTHITQPQHSTARAVQWSQVTNIARYHELVDIYLHIYSLPGHLVTDLTAPSHTSHQGHAYLGHCAQ